MLRNFVLSLLLIVITSKSSYAYLDPGTGSMVLQALAAGFFVCIFFAKQILEKSVEYF